MTTEAQTSIDLLLEQYLQLLDTYTALQTRLSTTQAAIQHHIARANFSAPRGVRYGEPLYDTRMQASRRCYVDVSDATMEAGDDAKVLTSITPGGDTEAMRMFGILVPGDLRVAQKAAGALVAQLVPRLVTTDRQMRALEVRIQKARKWREESRKKGR